MYKQMNLFTAPYEIYQIIEDNQSLMKMMSKPHDIRAKSVYLFTNSSDFNIHIFFQHWYKDD